MLIITAKFPRRKIAAGLAAAALVCCCAVGVRTLGIPTLGNLTARDTKSVRSNQDRIDYLASYGWEVAEQPLATQELLIPEQLDDSYTEYLQLQSQQGFDLSACAGKRLKRYTYEILNYPTGERGVQANLLICKNRVVGGEVLSSRLDGFLHGLSMP